MAVKVTPVITHTCSLEFRSGSSDKVYHIWIENVGANHTVKFQYGRRGSTLVEGIKIGPTHAKAAQNAYHKVLAEKLGKGYKEMPKRTGPVGKSGPVGVTGVAGTPGPIKRRVIGVADESGKVVTLGNVVSPQLLNPIGEEHLMKLIKDDKWIMQEKHDGKRMMLSRTRKGKLTAFNRSGKEITPPEEYCSALQKFGNYHFIIDGEACGPVFYVFDILALESTDCSTQSLEDRLSLLGMLMRSVPEQDTIRMVYTAFTRKQKDNLLRAVKESGREGIAAKDSTAPYTSGRPHSMGPALKFKLVESVSCQVTKVNDKRSVMLMLQKGVHVGSVTIPVNHEIPEVNDIVEVQYLYAYKGGSLYQPVYKGKRDDIDQPDSISKLKYKPEEK